MYYKLAILTDDASNAWKRNDEARWKESRITLVCLDFIWLWSAALTFLLEGEVLCEMSALMVPTQKEQSCGVVNLERPQVEDTLENQKQRKERHQRCTFKTTSAQNTNTTIERHVLLKAQNRNPSSKPAMFMFRVTENTQLLKDEGRVKPQQFASPSQGNHTHSQSQLTGRFRITSWPIKHVFGLWGEGNWSAHSTQLGFKPGMTQPLHHCPVSSLNNWKRKILHSCLEKLLASFF